MWMWMWMWRQFVIRNRFSPYNSMRCVLRYGRGIGYVNNTAYYRIFCFPKRTSEEIKSSKFACTKAIQNTNRSEILEWLKMWCLWDILWQLQNLNSLWGENCNKKLEMWGKTPGHQKWLKLLHFIKNKVNMLEVFNQLKSFFTFRRITSEGLVFKLHYRATMCIILGFCLMVAARQYVGDPIKCIHGKDLPNEVINTFCWVHSTFSVKSAFLKRVGIDISHPGIENSLAGEKPRKEYRYYQWVVFCLLLQVSGRLTHRKKAYASLACDDVCLNRCA
jgi:hypothetical protein